MKLKVCSISKKTKAQDTILYKSMQNLNVDLHMEVNNTNKGLGKFYNECISNYNNVDALVFIHDDVHLINTDLDYQLTNAFKNFDVVGVAGCVNPKIIEKNLWHWMGETKENLRGMAGHACNGADDFVVTSFGFTPARTVIIDGVFMALKMQKIREFNVKFDENFMFHHYDMDFSLTCNKNRLKMGVWPILINHQSPGLKGFDKNFEDSNSYFINKWKNK